MTRLIAFYLVLAAGIGPSTALSAADSAVVVMYHRFGESAYPSTNIKLEQFEGHLRELSKPEYSVLPIPEIVSRLKSGSPLPDRTVGISIDDAFLSVYQKAFPRLKKMGLPFTLFVATRPIDQNLKGYMSWDQIRELKKNGVTIGSQTNSHLHMAQASESDNRIDLQASNSRFRAELGETPNIIAYPYGEYSLAVGRLSQEEGLITGFGQHSGVLHSEADMLYLPRWAMNENYGDIKRFKMAINALPLTIAEISPADPLLSAANNPPILGFTVKGPAAKKLSNLACYASRQGKTRIERLGRRVEIRLKAPFASGRARINCTMPTQSGRWRWHGFQFYVPPS